MKDKLKMDPINAIKQDRLEARKVEDPNADTCFLALASKEGKASVRTLILRDIVDNRFVLFINQTSPKWQLFSDQSHYELLLWYPSQQKQYRINGSCQALDHKQVGEKWQRRPQGSKFLDYVYKKMPQSSAIESRQMLTDEIKRLKEEYNFNDMAPPSEVAGVELIADKIEMLDLNREDRIHDRQSFTLDEGLWKSLVLVP